VGRLRLVEFPPHTPLTPEGASYFKAPVGTELPAADPVVRQGMLEASNVNGMSAAVSLIALQRHAEMLQRVLTIFHTDFNRAAAQDLPRI
jgi:flagellar basal-body rod protein FlgF/flagellar basal-body rod protein FlgG